MPEAHVTQKILWEERVDMSCHFDFASDVEVHDYSHAYKTKKKK